MQADQLSSIMSRGHKLKARMDECLEPDDAWLELHGGNKPKKYTPPFMV
jgi:hypothetical protein